MNLVQKLPIGLGLACMMMLSSCSKEDVQVAEPHEASMAAVSEASLKVRGPVLPSSQGTVTGNANSNSGSLPGWSALHVLGVSNFKYLLGDPSFPG